MQWFLAMQISAQLYELIRLDLNFGEGAELGVETFLFCVSEIVITIADNLIFFVNLIC